MVEREGAVKFDGNGQLDGVQRAELSAHRVLADEVARELIVGVQHANGTDRLPPDVAEEARLLAADLVTTTLSGVGKDFSTRPQAMTEVEIFADGLADMLCAYLEGLGRKANTR